MHLIFFTSLVSSGPPESGYEIANKALLDGLRRQGARVTEIGFKWVSTELSDPDNTICLGDVDVKTEGARRRQKIKWLARAVRTGQPFACAKLRILSDNDIDAALKQAERRGGPVDGIILNGVTLAGAYERYLTKRPYLYVAHNVEHVSARQNAKDASGPVEKFMYQREARYLKALETRLCARASHVLTLSEEDREGLHVGGDTRSTYVPLVTPQPLGTSRDGRVKAFDVGLIGTWTWTPNRIGLEWFLRDVVPHLDKTIQVAIAGKTPKGMRARSEQVKLLGRVLDAKDFTRQNRVMALTSRVGTGVQLKTIEAFEMGLACVATPSSMRGISHIPDNVKVADKPKEFAATLNSQVAAQRAGTLPSVDGQDFRNAQLRAMDSALAAALTHLNATPEPSHAGR
ncbi:MAG: glycosyltransferase family 4 protein [Ahrensia sp.]